MKYIPYILPAFANVLYIKKHRTPTIEGKEEPEPFDWGNSIEALLEHKWAIFFAVIAILFVCILLYIFQQYLREIPNRVYILIFLLLGLIVMIGCIMLS